MLSSRLPWAYCGHVPYYGTFCCAVTALHMCRYAEVIFTYESAQGLHVAIKCPQLQHGVVGLQHTASPHPMKVDLHDIITRVPSMQAGAQLRAAAGGAGEQLRSLADGAAARLPELRSGVSAAAASAAAAVRPQVEAAGAALSAAAAEAPKLAAEVPRLAAELGSAARPAAEAATSAAVGAWDALEGSLGSLRDQAGTLSETLSESLGSVLPQRAGSPAAQLPDLSAGGAAGLSQALDPVKDATVGAAGAMGESMGAAATSMADALAEQQASPALA